MEIEGTILPTYQDALAVADRKDSLLSTSYRSDRLTSTHMNNWLLNGPTPTETGNITNTRFNILSRERLYSVGQRNIRRPRELTWLRHLLT